MWGVPTYLLKIKIFRDMMPYGLVNVVDTVLDLGELIFTLISHSQFIVFHACYEHIPVII